MCRDYHNQVPSFIPNSNPQPCPHNQPCHSCTPYSYNQSPCNRNYNRNCGSRNRCHQPQPRGQCHMHSQYDMQCHACNDPLPLGQLATKATSYQYCQCYRCQKSRNEPTLHPLVGLPLAIATGGLSCAAMGIYRGVTLSRRAKKAQNLGLNQNQMGGLDMSMLEKEQQLENGGYIVPSPVSAVSPTVSELQGASPLERKHSIAVSEMIGSPVEPAPPRYSEVMGTEVGEKM